VRVLFLNPVGELGGGERSLLDLVAALRDEQPALTVGVIAGTDGPLLAKASALGAWTDLVRLPASMAGLGDSSLRSGQGAVQLAAGLLRATQQSARYAAQLRQSIRAFGPDLLHSNGMKMHLLGALTKGRVPLIWHVRDFASERPLMSRLLRRAAPRVRVAIANSRAVAEDLRQVAPRLDVRTVYNGIDVAHFCPGPGDPVRLDALTGMGLPAEGTVRIGLVATWARWKGQDVFLRAMARLRELAPKVAVRGYVIGGPIYRTAASQFTHEELAELAGALELRGVVGFVPFQEDVRDLYRTLDVVVHASTRPEPFGRTIAEAMACGRAVVASEGGGASELFDDGKEGLRVERGDPEALALTLHGLSRRPELREALGAAARVRAQRSYDRRRLGRELLEVYRDLTGAR
jgi:glycosyltransferase involved in cell wall biosynthesis